jgi:hypothetical protein
LKVDGNNYFISNGKGACKKADMLCALIKFFEIREISKELKNSPIRIV